jgi:hypothetical protein
MLRRHAVPAPAVARRSRATCTGLTSCSNMPAACRRKEPFHPWPTVLQNAHLYPSKWPLTCYFFIPRRVKPAFRPPRVREIRVAQVSAPRPGKPVPLSPAESHCVPFRHRIFIRPPAGLPAQPTALTHAAAARLKRSTLEIRFASQFSQLSWCKGPLSQAPLCRHRELGLPVRKSRLDFPSQTGHIALRVWMPNYSVTLLR